MTKRLIEIDDELLEQARKAAKSSTIRGTVEIALRGLVDRDKAIQHVERLRGSGALEPALAEEARRPRFGDTFEDGRA